MIKPTFQLFVEQNNNMLRNLYEIIIKYNDDIIFEDFCKFTYYNSY